MLLGVTLGKASAPALFPAQRLLCGITWVLIDDSKLESDEEWTLGFEVVVGIP